MAPIKNILAALALASFTTAMPVDKRAPNVVTETTWTTVDVTTTVYVNGASPKPEVDNAPPPAPAVPTTTAAAESSPPAAEQQPAAQSPGNAPAAFAAQPPQPSPAAVSSSSAAAAPVAAEAAAPAPASTQATQGTQGTPAKSSGGSGGPCEGQGSGCAGDATHWDGGLGACGWNVNTASDMQIALPVGLMGSQSNGNPYCGRSVSIKTPNGGTVSATVGDKCMGCTGDSIDMTDALFAAAVPGGDGRVSNVEWWFD